MKYLWKKRAALSIISTLMCAMVLLLLETATRVIRPEINFQDTEQSLQRKNAFGNSWGWVPNATGICFGKRITIDEFGCRKMASPENYTSSWLIIGDSVTFGVGIDTEDTYIQLFQNNLPTVKLWNTAVLGFDFRNYMDVLHHYMADNRAGPDLKKVFLFICLNDVDLQGTVEDNRHVNHVATDFIGQTISFFRRNSKLYGLLKNTVSDRSKFYFLHDYQFYQKDNEKFIESMKIVDEMNTLLRSKNIDFQIIILPYEYQLRTKEDQYLIPQKLLSAHFNGQGVPYIDAYPYFEGAGNKQKNFLYADAMHLSKNGHQVVANILKEHFTAK